MSEADQLIRDLRMVPHPEGGYFIECLRNDDVSIIYYLLKKHEKVFVGVLTPEGDVVDYTNEENRNPEEQPT